MTTRRCTWLRTCDGIAVTVVHSAVGTHPVCADCRASIARIYAAANERIGKGNAS